MLNSIWTSVLRSRISPETFSCISSFVDWKYPSAVTAKNSSGCVRIYSTYHLVQVNPTTHTDLPLCAENRIVEELNFSGAAWIATLGWEILPVKENSSIAFVRLYWNNEWDKSYHYLLIYGYRFSFWASSLIWFSSRNCSSFPILILSPKQKNPTKIVYVGINLLNQWKCILELNTKNVLTCPWTSFILKQKGKCSLLYLKKNGKS